MKRLLILAALLLGVAACATQDPGPVAPFVRPSPGVTLAGAEVVPYLARITWDVTDGTGVEFEIDRQLDTRPWKDLTTITTNIEGRMVLEDPSVQPGQTYHYRVRAVGVTTETFQGEVTIVVPVM
jgi:hypothetical protein